MTERIRIIGRVRPQLAHQINKKYCISFTQNKLILNEGFNNQYNFPTIGPDKTQTQVYNRIGMVEVQKMFKGQNSTIFVMGTKGSGKSYTLIGKQGKQSKGIIPRAFEQIKQKIKSQPENLFLLQVSSIGIRKNRMYDLLNSNKNELNFSKDMKNNSIENLRIKSIKNLQQLEAYLDYATSKQSKSFRKEETPHFIFAIYLEIKINNQYMKGQINFVEISDEIRGKDDINQSNLVNLQSQALKNVINELSYSSKIKQQVFLDSKLLWLVRECFEEKTNTTFILTINQYEQDELLNEYLQKGLRLRQMKKLPKRRQGSASKLKQLLETIQKYKLDQNYLKVENINEFDRNREQIYHNQFMISPQQIHKQKYGINTNKNSGQSIKLQELSKRIINFPHKSFIHKNQALEIQNKSTKQKLIQQECEQRQRQNELLQNQLESDQEKRKMIIHLERQFHKQRSKYLQTIRYLEKNLSLYKQIAQALLSKEKVKIIQSNSQYCSLTRTYKVPNFTFKNDFLKIKPLKTTLERYQIQKLFQSSPLIMNQSIKRQNKLYREDQDGIKNEQKSFFSPYLTHRTQKSGQKNSYKSQRKTQGNEYMIIPKKTPSPRKKQIMSRSWSKKFR